MALQQHLGDACRAAEVAVDLERRMGTEKVGIGACTMASVKSNGGLEEVPQKMIGMVAIMEARPETDCPSPRQPVPSSPRRRKVSRQASINSGILDGVNMVPGYRPKRCDT